MKQAGSNIIHGDCLKVLRTLESNSIDSIITDPPSGIAFMNKSWDKDKGGRDQWIAWLREIMQECLRVLKPGGHAFVWALPRTSHWTALALEDAGFEIRDSVVHVFGQGFPKSLDIGKAIDKAAGVEREIVDTVKKNPYSTPDTHNGWNRPSHNAYAPATERNQMSITAPSTEYAKKWDGWHTGLKPAHEVWWLCRKPIDESSIAANVLKWGTGGINVDESRIKTTEYDRNRGTRYQKSTSAPRFNGTSYASGEVYKPAHTWVSGGHIGGRFPANLLLSHTLFCVPTDGTKIIHGRASGYNFEPGSNNNNTTHIITAIKSGVHYGDEEVQQWECTDDCPVRLLDEQSGISRSLKSGFHGRKPGIPTYGIHDVYNKSKTTLTGGMEYGDTGGASRYFQNFHPTQQEEEDEIVPFLYTPKASQKERNAGCEAIEKRFTATMNDGIGEREHNPELPGAWSHNHHPTVKPLALMRYLITMITPPGGIVLDMFAGSGSTGVAAILSGFNYILIEQEEQYIDIIQARIAHAQKEQER